MSASRATRLDEISAFGDKVRFLIPHDWVEGDDQDNGTCLYHAPNADSGWFRLSVITLANVESPEKRLSEIVASEKKEYALNQESGNYVASWEKDSTEDGVPIRLYYWSVMNVVWPNLIRKAVISYTILAGRISDPQTVETIDVLKLIVPRTTFPAAGEELGSS
jgi:hypothetical protein